MGRQAAPRTAPASALSSIPGTAATPVTPGLQAFWGLERWLSSAPSQHLGLSGIERESERQGREMLRLLLQAHIDGRGDGDVGGRCG